MKRGISKRKRVIRTLLVILGTAIISIIIYEIPRKSIQVQQVTIQQGGIMIKGRAHELIVQDISEQGVWASRGFDIYFKEKDDYKFERISRVPIPFGTNYALGFRTFRHMLNKHEALELIHIQVDTLIAFGGGFIFNSVDNGKTFKAVDKMKHYGFNAGRGIMPQGYAVDRKGNMYWGEYWRNSEKEPVRLMKSTDKGNTWETVLEFNESDIRHIHSVQYDSVFDAIWLTTGDLDDECQIMYSTNNGENFSEIGSGSQKWRAVSLLFGHNKVFWGMDGTNKETPLQIWSWDRSTGETEGMANIYSRAFYSTTLDNGIMCLSTDGLNDPATLWLCRDQNNWEQAAQWERKRQNHFGTIRMASAGNDLIISNINLTDFNNELLFIELK